MMNQQQIIDKIEFYDHQIHPQPQKNLFKEFFIYGKINLTIKQQKNKILTLLQFILVLIIVLHIIITECIISSQQGNFITSIIQVFQEQSKFYRIIQVVMIILNAFLIFSVYMEITGKQYIVGVSWITQQVLKYLGLLKQINIFFSAFICIIDLYQNLAIFIISCLINMFHAIYLQNYVIRKQLTYVSSFSNYIGYRFFIVLNYTVNIVSIRLKSSVFFLFFYSISAIIVLLWFIKYGCNLFHHQIIRKIQLIFISMLLAIYFNIFLNLTFSLQPSQLSKILNLILMFVVLIFYLRMITSKLDDRSMILKKKTIKQIDLSLSKTVQRLSTNTELEAYLIGLLYLNNVNIQDKSKLEYYDPILRNYLKEKDLYIQRQSTLQLYIKTLYEDIIQSQNVTDANVYIDFCEFLCNYNWNYFQISRYIIMAKACPLNIQQRIKINRIESLLRQSNMKLNLLIYDGNLELQEIIQSQQCFYTIETKIKSYIKGYLNVCSLFKLQSISLLSFRLHLTRLFSMVQSININWKKIIKFFPINKKWSLIYINYLYFIKNQALKQNQTDIFKSIKTQDEIMNDKQAIFFTNNWKQADLHNPLILFDEDTCVIQSQYDIGDLIIKDVNKRFQIIFGFKKRQILNCSIETLMEESLRKKHFKNFNKWIQFGYISNENHYKVKQVQIITRQSMKYPAFKYFKVLLTQKNEVFFICMIKVNLIYNVIQKNSSSDFSQNIFTSSAIDKSLDKPFIDTKIINHFPSSLVNQQVQKNIFIKQDMLQPLADFEFKEIKYFKRFSRVFLFTIISSIIILLIITNKNATSLTSYSNQFINYMNMYRFPVIIATNYMKSFLNVGNVAQVNRQIKTASTNFLAGASLQLTKKTLFNQLLNPSNTYYPYYEYPFLRNQSYSQIDLFFMMSSSISTLSNIPINQTNPQFQKFNSYLKPSYDNMMNTTKFLLHQKFAHIFESCISDQLIFTMIQLVFFFICLIILFNFIHHFIIKMRNILYIILDFNENQVNTIFSYWKYQRQHFNNLFIRFDIHQRSTKILSSSNIIKKLDIVQRDEDKLSMNKKSKYVQQDRQRKCFQLKLRMITIVFMVAIITISVSVEAYMIEQLKYLKSFEEAGFFFLKYFPTGPLTTMGCTEKYYADRFPNQIKFNPQKYDDVLSSMYIFGNNNYIGQVEDSTSPYFNKQKYYFFGNPCEYNPNIIASIGINISKCTSIANGTFKQGLSSFLRYGQRLGERCIYNKVNLTATELDQFTIAGTILSAYVLDSITTWVTQFAQKVIILERQNFIQSFIVIICIFLIHFFVIQLKMMKVVFSEYEFTKKVYLYLVPQSILISEKVIRQKFIINGLIQA